jgi:hypothetical protein
MSLRAVSFIVGVLAGVAVGWLLYRRKKQREEAEAYALWHRYNWAQQRGDNLATTCDIKTPRFNYIKRC